MTKSKRRAKKGRFDEKNIRIRTVNRKERKVRKKELSFVGAGL
jgi:hypothetical protein